MSDHNYFANLIWQIADLLRGLDRPPQYERVMLRMTVLRHFDCVLAHTKSQVLAEYTQRIGGKLSDEALDLLLSRAAGQRFHNHSPLDFEKLKGDPDNIDKHLVSDIKSFLVNVRAIFDFFEYSTEIEKLREIEKLCEAKILCLPEGQRALSRVKESLHSKCRCHRSWSNVLSSPMSRQRQPGWTRWPQRPNAPSPCSRSAALIATAVTVRIDAPKDAAPRSEGELSC